mmetsp:Transcript_160176/g.307357  ORF Transcript_160176/g.307357 Transcript_160176/m.307357 type:complete len:208 (+) Transcript_160176:358-981(+)
MKPNADWAMDWAAPGLSPSIGSMSGCLMLRLLQSHSAKVGADSFLCMSADAVSLRDKGLCAAAAAAISRSAKFNVQRPRKKGSARKMLIPRTLAQRKVTMHINARRGLPCKPIMFQRSSSASATSSSSSSRSVSVPASLVGGAGSAGTACTWDCDGAAAGSSGRLGVACWPASSAPSTLGASSPLRLSAATPCSICGEEDAASAAVS